MPRQEEPKGRSGEHTSTNTWDTLSLVLPVMFGHTTAWHIMQPWLSLVPSRSPSRRYRSKTTSCRCWWENYSGDKYREVWSDRLISQWISCEGKSCNNVLPARRFFVVRSGMKGPFAWSFGLWLLGILLRHEESGQVAHPCEEVFVLLHEGAWLRASYLVDCCTQQQELATIFLGGGGKGLLVVPLMFLG